MTEKWNIAMARFVAEKVSELVRSDSGASDEERTLAAAFNAIQVYSDMSGALGVVADGTILFYDADSGVARQVTDKKWITIAAVSAATKYPALKDMLPVRPSSAKSCSSCEGMGRQIKGTVLCGACSGLGWVMN